MTYSERLVILVALMENSTIIDTVHELVNREVVNKDITGYNLDPTFTEEQELIAQDLLRGIRSMMYGFPNESKLQTLFSGLFSRDSLDNGFTLEPELMSDVIIEIDDIINLDEMDYMDSSLLERASAESTMLLGTDGCPSEPVAFFGYIDKIVSEVSIRMAVNDIGSDIAFDGHKYSDTTFHRLSIVKPLIFVHTLYHIWEQGGYPLENMIPLLTYTLPKKVEQEKSDV